MENIIEAWTDTANSKTPSNFAPIAGSAKVVRLGPRCAWVTVRYTFKTNGELPALCSGQIGLTRDSTKSWKIWHISTILEQFQEYPSPDKFPQQVMNGLEPTCQKTHDYTCCIIGAGFSGLCLAARLKALGVKYLTLETNARIGDNWRHRYDSATCTDLPS